MKKLFEFRALLDCAYVVAADNEEAARKTIESFEAAWYESGDFIGVKCVNLFDIRGAKADHIEDLAHESV